MKEIKLQICSKRLDTTQNSKCFLLCHRVALLSLSEGSNSELARIRVLVRLITPCQDNCGVFCWSGISVQLKCLNKVWLSKSRQMLHVAYQLLVCGLLVFCAWLSSVLALETSLRFCLCGIWRDKPLICTHEAQRAAQRLPICWGGISEIACTSSGCFKAVRGFMEPKKFDFRLKEIAFHWRTLILWQQVRK